MTKVTTERCRELRHQGWTVREIAIYFGVRKSDIARRLNPTAAQCIERRKMGFSADRIAAEFGVTKGIIAGILHRAGWKAPPKRTVQTMEKERARPSKEPSHEARERPVLPVEPRLSDAEALKALRRSLPTNGYRPKECQWIEGEPSHDDGCKCGRPTNGQPWCAAHRRRAYKPRIALS